MSNADRVALLALAARVEGLSNPDRQLDALVGANINGTIDVPGVLGCYFPPYTASIDAAKTLVPKGWHVGMLTECDEEGSPSCCLTQNEEPWRDAIGRGADMALSLVAAAMRARASSMKDAAHD